MKHKCLAIVLAAALLVLSGCGPAYLQPEQADAPEGAFWVSYLDVGQADAALV